MIKKLDAMTERNPTTIRNFVALAAICLGFFAVSMVIWSNGMSVIGTLSIHRPSVAYQNLIMIGTIIGLSSLSLLSLMIPESRSIEASIADITRQTTDAEASFAGIEKEVTTNLDRIINLLKNHSEVSRLYSTSLDNAGRNLIELTSPEQLRMAIGYLIAENNKMRKETGDLQANLKESEVQIERLRENLELAEKTGMKDSLTSLWNRRAFDKMLDLQVELAPQKKTPVCLILVDIDHFKKINDRFGHLVGDEILKLVGNTLAKNVKGRDFIARFGGEEFAIILPETSLGNAIILASQLRQHLESQKWVLSKRNEVVGTVTASFGISQLRSGESKESFLEHADKKLYDAKNSGRNRVVS